MLGAVPKGAKSGLEQSDISEKIEIIQTTTHVKTREEQNNSNIFPLIQLQHFDQHLTAETHVSK